MGKSKDKKGYVRINAEDHPRAYFGTVHEHIIVMEKYLGRPIPKGAIVHHKNRVRSDNRIENLLLLRNQDDHRCLHRAMDNGDTGIVQAFEDWSQAFMETLKSGLPEAQCFSSSLAVVENAEVESDDSEKLVARRNRITKKLFIEFSDDVIISPDGKDIELDPERFCEPEEVSESDLTEKQLKVYRNKMKGIESVAIEQKKRKELLRKLFVELRKERKRLADEKGVPAYIVFEDKTLIEMAEIMPSSESLMLQVSGIGPAKLRLFGAQFIAVVKKFKKAFSIV